jgi:hypothetical protein
MKAEPLVVYLPDRRDVVVDRRWTKGNNKIGMEVYTYSRLAGRENIQELVPDRPVNLGTCPGSSEECERICYAKRIQGEVLQAYVNNSITNEVPRIPADAQIVRAHVSGDFDTPEYILSWVRRLVERPDVTFWAYTRSWRCHSLLEFLEVLRALPNVQLFASMDKSVEELPPLGWRVAWIDGDERAGTPMGTRAHHLDSGRLRTRNFETVRGSMSFICPEETGHKANCTSCRYCFDGQQNDVTFLQH